MVKIYFHKIIGVAKVIKSLMKDIISILIGKSSIQNMDDWALYMFGLEKDPNKMVGRPKENFKLIANDIIKKIRLSKEDILLDFACGNGEITKLLAERCKKVIGIDQSQYLIDYARLNNQSRNIIYIKADDTNFYKKIPKNIRFNKIVSCAGIGQYVSKEEFRKFFINLKQLLEKHFIILIKDVQYYFDKSTFHPQNLESRLRRLRRRILFRITKKREVLFAEENGFWWKIDDVYLAVRDIGTQIRISKHPYFKYRIDFTIIN